MGFRWPRLTAMLGLLVLPLGCERPAGPPKNAKKAPSSVASQPTTDRVILPEYRFADDALETKHPEAAAFVREFLETCLSGDYDAYRKLVSRNEEPQSKEKFDRVYAALRNIEVESIEPLSQDDARKLPSPTGLAPTGPVYRIVSGVHFDPAANISLRYRSRKLAILAFEEDGQWRMRVAPSKHQPRDERPTTTQATETQPVDELPDFPWDEDGDH